MMKIKRVLFVFIIFTVGCSTVYAQDNKTIGFACGFGGTPTESVLMMEEFLYKMDFDTIRNNINSKEPSIQFLAAVIIKRLDKEGLIKLTLKEKDEILILSLSKRYIHTCFGCTEYDYSSMIDVFKSKDEMQIKDQAIIWVDEILRKIN